MKSLIAHRNIFAIDETVSTNGKPVNTGTGKIIFYLFTEISKEMTMV